jgi:CDP-paratose synthetase
MKILLTGPTGFLGSHLARSLLAAGHSMVLMKRSFSNTWRLGNLLSRVVSYDLDKSSLDQIFSEQENIDVILHTATCYGRNEEPASAVLEANIAFPLRLLEAAQSHGTNTFFNSDTTLSRALNPYSLSKSHFKEWGKKLTSERKPHFVNVRLGHVYGPRDDPSKFTSWVVRSCLNNVPQLNLTLGEQMRDFIYIDDVVSAFVLLIDKLSMDTHQGKEFDVGSGQPVSIRYFVEMAHRLSRSQTKLNFGALPYREAEVMHSEANVEPLRSLGWACQMPLADGVLHLLNWETRGQK